MQQAVENKYNGAHSNTGVITVCDLDLVADSADGALRMIIRYYMMVALGGIGTHDAWRNSRR